MFAERLKELRKSKGITQTEFAKIFNISNGTIGNWESGNRIPDTEMLKMLADFFNVSIDYLVGKSEYKNILDEQLSDVDFALYGEIHDLSDEEKQKIIDFVKFTKSQRRE